MAERLVLAELIVDSNGVVKGVKDATDSFKFLPDAVAKQGKAAAEASDKYLGAIEHRFFGFRHVAGALLGGFTIAGLVEGFKTLAVEAAKGTEGFAAMEVSLTNASHAAADLLGSMIGINENVNRSQGFFQSLADSFTVLSNVIKKVPWYAIPGVLAMGTPAFQGPGALGSNFIGPPSPAIIGNAGYNPDARAAGFIGPPSPIGIGNRGYTYFNGKLIETSKAVRVLTNDLGELSHAWALGGPDNTLLDAYDKAIKAGDDYNETLETSLALPKKFERELESMNAELSKTGLQFQFAQVAAQAFAQAMTDAALSGNLSLKKFLGEMIMSVGQAIVAVGGLMMARGFLTYNAAEVAKGAGVVALGAATIAIGNQMAKSGSPSASGGIAAAAEAASGGGGPQYSNTYNFNGPTIGFSKEQFIRWVNDLQRRGVGSNA